MDQQQRGLAEAVAKLTGVVTALEVQGQALLLAAVRAGTHPDFVLRALHDVPRPVLPLSARDAYERAMAGFERRLDEAALEALAPAEEHAGPTDPGPTARLGTARRGPLRWLLALLVLPALTAAFYAAVRLTAEPSGPEPEPLPAAAPSRGTQIAPDPP
jgi:hypothetical protein